MVDRTTEGASSFVVFIFLLPTSKLLFYLRLACLIIDKITPKAAGVGGTILDRRKQEHEEEINSHSRKKFSATITGLSPE